MLMLALSLCGCVASAEKEEADCIGRWVVTGYLSWEAENLTSEWMGCDELVQVGEDIHLWEFLPVETELLAE